MKLSIIVPTHNRPKALIRNLAALSRQSLDRTAFEVLVIDDGSSQHNQPINEQATLDQDFTYVLKEQGGLVSARNAGAERATGDILYFLDDDVVPAKDTLREILSWHEREEDPIAVLGSVPFPEESLKNPFIWYLDRHCHYEPFKHPEKYPDGKPLPPMNGNSSIRRQTFFDVGMYDDRFHQYGAEDNELGVRLLEAGISARYNENAIGWHHHEKTFKDYCLDQEKAGESIIWLYRKYPLIKSHKNIDIMVDTFQSLPLKKKVRRLIMFVTLTVPVVLWPARLLVGAFGSCFALRYVLSPAFQWVSLYHYAVGMRRALNEAG